jgi:uncharacterized membrane-anchored protein YjiN (DUF445 family)
MTSAPASRTTTTESPLDAERARDLRRMKLFATGLLVAVTLLFVAARLADGHVTGAGVVESFAEAAMVGALADWFAVTALFRHPMGLPIPHTAIIPHRKDQIGASLGQFVEENFLTAELLDERLQRAHVGARLGEWLRQPANAARASAAAGDVVRGAIDVLDDEAISGSIEHMVERRIRATEVSPLMGRAIDLAVEGGHHQRLLDSTLVALEHFLDDNRLSFRERLQHESPWWVPESIDDRIFDKIYTSVHSFLHDLGRDPHHDVRRSIDARVVAFAERLAHDPGLIRKGEELKEELLAHPDVRAWIGSLWGEIRTSLEQASVDPESELRMRMTTSLAQLGERLGTDMTLQAKIDSWVSSAAGYVVENYRGEVSRMISSTVERWDAESTSRRLELQVGRDLQFIRINGTLVGGLAGLVIHVISQLI